MSRTYDDKEGKIIAEKQSLKHNLYYCHQNLVIAWSRWRRIILTRGGTLSIGAPQLGRMSPPLERGFLLLQEYDSRRAMGEPEGNSGSEVFLATVSITIV